jgi:SAM-dependent methyltransferase
MEQILCPVCKSSEYKFLFDRLDHTHYVTNDRFRIVRCRKCAMVFVNPRPDPSEIAGFYPPVFYDIDISAERLLEEKRPALEARAKLLGDTKPGRLLDVGCQKGEFLHWMRLRGWEVQGVEFSETPPNVFGLPIFYGRLEHAPFAAAFFDVVTAWAVLEHVHDPVDTLTHIARVLRPGGRAFVLVPNFRSLPAQVMRHDDVPRHLMMFTPDTLRRAASKAGLRVQRTVFSDDIFSGSTRGVLNFVVKRALGESYDEILRQNRSAERWSEFASTVHGRPSALVRLVDRLDRRVTPHLDALMRAMRCSFIMTAELSPLPTGRRVGV